MLRHFAAVLAACLLLAGTTTSQAATGQTGRIEGIVQYQGRPVVGATVTTSGQTAYTDSAGKFAFRPVSVAGKVLLTTVSVTAPGYGEWQLTQARVLPNDTLRVTADLSRQPVSIQQPAPTGPAPPVASASRTTASSSTLPSTIRVYVTGSWHCNVHASGATHVVDFKYYVKHVLPNEWYPSWARESLRAGAMAAKSYAWYYINQGGKWPRYGADVMDSTCDQVYNPAVSYASTDQAVDDTWNWKITRNGEVYICLFWAGYQGDGSKPTGAYAGWMSQWGSEYWAQRGKTWDWILHYYFDNTVISQMGAATALGGSVSINRGAPYTGSTSVTLGLSRTDNAKYVRISNASVTDSAGRLAQARTYAYRTPISWPLDDSATGGSTANGLRAVYVQWGDGFGSWSPIHSDTIYLDTHAPVVTVPAAGFVRGAMVQDDGAEVRLSWSGRDAGSGVGRYKLQQSVDSSRYIALGLAPPNSTYAVLRLMWGHTYHFRVRAIDRVGHASPWAVKTFRLDLFQENHSAISYSGVWRRVRDSSALGDHVEYPSGRSPMLTFSFSGKAVAWIAPTTSRSASARVHVSGRRRDIGVSLQAQRPGPRRVVFAWTYPRDQGHVLYIYPGAENESLVRVDGFLVIR